jgi:hypothetical protein
MKGKYAKMFFVFRWVFAFFEKDKSFKSYLKCRVTRSQHDKRGQTRQKRMIFIKKG